MALSQRRMAGNSHRIHFVTEDDKGQAKVLPRQTRFGVLGGSSYVVACDHEWSNLTGVPVVRDPRGVTCPECRATPEYNAAMNLYLPDGVTA